MSKGCLEVPCVRLDMEIDVGKPLKPQPQQRYHVLRILIG